MKMEDVIAMVIAHAEKAYTNKVAEFERDMDRIWKIWCSNPTFEDVLECFLVADQWMRVWAQWGFPEEQAFCRRQLALRRPEMVKVERLARKLLAREIAANKSKQ